MKRYLECFMCVMYTYMYTVHIICIFVCDNLKVQLFIIMMMCGVIVFDLSVLFIFNGNTPCI